MRPQAGTGEDGAMWRQGDVLLTTVASVPEGAKKLPHCTLAEGEFTGHSHRVAEKGVAELYELNGALFLDVTAESATVVHDEHGPVTLRRGTYRVTRQREYTPREVINVRD